MLFVGGNLAKSLYSSAQILCNSLVGSAGSAELIDVVALGWSGVDGSVLDPRARSRACLMITESPSEAPVWWLGAVELTSVVEGFDAS